MVQTPAKRITSRGDAIDYTPTSNVSAGDVVTIGTIPMVATQAISANCLGSLACEGVFDLPKTSDVFVAGDAVYWNSAATDVSGNTGAADNASGDLIGVAVANAASGDAAVRTKLTAAKRTTTIGGSVTADDITGSDSSLGITGLAGNAGGAVVITGGAGSQTGGGAVTITGGAASGNNGNGGNVAIDGGAPHGSGTAGSITIGTNASAVIFGLMPQVPVTAVTAAGGNIATAAALSAGVNLVTGSDNAKGVILPACANGKQVVIINLNTDKTLKVYPPVSKQVNGAGANNAITMTANTVGAFWSEGTNAYYGFAASAPVS